MKHVRSFRAFLPTQIRSVSMTSNNSKPSQATTVGEMISPSPPRDPTQQPSLARLPLSNVLRSLCILTASSSPLLLRPSIYVLSALSNPRTALTDVSRNPVLHWLVKNTIYKQFSAGETKDEVQHSIAEIKKLGHRGVLLGYARELLVKDNEANVHDEATARKEVDAWLQGTLETVDMVSQGDFVALKLTGMGQQAVYRLRNRLPPTDFMDAAIRSACDAAISKQARILVDAEEQAVQPGIDEWVMRYQEYCNKRTPGTATMYGTYQAYLKSTPERLARHLATAESQGFTLGVKLVRGAYLRTEPRHLIWDTKADTDKCYDGIVEAILTRRYNSVLKPHEAGSDKSVPLANLLIATHNRDSVLKAQALRMKQAEAGEQRVPVAYAQLQGMADEVSFELMTSSVSNDSAVDPQGTAERTEVYKLLTWGTVPECMGFLFRRAIENTEAVGRTKDSQTAMARELKRRIARLFGWR